MANAFRFIKTASSHLITALVSQGVPEEEAKIQVEYLPNIGFHVSYMAFGFLRLVEGGFAQIDTLTTNATYPPDIRHEAISAVIDSLIQTAKDLKLKGLICLTKEESVLTRANDLGFHQVNQQVIALHFD